MKILFVFFCILLFPFYFLIAQDQNQRPKKPAASPAVEVSPTPSPKKRSFLKKLNPFSKRKETESVSPTIEPKPSPKPTKAIKSTQPVKPPPVSSPRHEITSSPNLEIAPQENLTAPSMSEPIPFIPPASTDEKNKPLQIKEPDPNEEIKEKARYREVKMKALENKTIQELKEKADNATNEDEKLEASEKYNNALFDEMRKLDETLKDRIDRMQKATLKRLHQNKL